MMKGVSRRAGLVGLVAVAAVGLAGTVLPVGAIREPAPDCGPEIYVPAVGPACLQANGLYRVTLPDGYVSETHGPDLVTEIHDAWVFGSVKQRNPSCIKNRQTEPHIQMLYVKPSDRPDRYSQMVPEIQKMIRMVNGFLYSEAREFDRTALYRMACSGGEVSILKVEVPLPANQLDYFSAMLAIRRAGYANPMAKYWAWVDRVPEQGGAAGVAGVISDDELSADNSANYGPHYHIDYNLTGASGASVIMHEGSHNLGAVQNSAPNSTLAGHCIDDSDVMCYPDGGPRGDKASFKINVCSEPHYDCKHNDYFNPLPKKSNYLWDHWNLASPLNRYLAWCSYKTGVMSLAAQGQNADVAGSNAPGWGAATKTVSIPTSCRGSKFALSAFHSPLPPQSDQVMGLHPGTQFNGGRPENGFVNQRAPADVNVCFYKNSKKLKCFQSEDEETGTVPADATKATITLNQGVDAIWVFSIT